MLRNRRYNVFATFSTKNKIAIKFKQNKPFLRMKNNRQTIILNSIYKLIALPFHKIEFSMSKKKARLNLV